MQRYSNIVSFERDVYLGRQKSDLNLNAVGMVCKLPNHALTPKRSANREEGRREEN